MSKQIAHEIIDRASEWFIEMREADISDSKREAFTEWLRASPAHVQAYLEVAGLWGDASQVSKDLPVEVAPAATNVIALEGAALEGAGVGGFGGIGTVPAGTHDRRHKAASGIAAIAASLLLILAGTSTWFYLQRGVYHTDIGEQRVITLEDGSIVRLNSRSKIRVRLTPHQRNIELLEGQAHFQVAKDPTRPFNVHTDDITARAVGTQFDVYRRKTGTTVTVVEGRIALVPDTALATVPGTAGSGVVGTVPPRDETHEALSGTAIAPTPQRDARHEAVAGTVLLAAGEQATISHAGRVEFQPRANIAAATGWLQQELIFTGEPLTTVIDEFNRYTRKTLILDDPTLAQFKINAAFNTTNPQGLLLFLSRMPGVEVVETDDQIHIRRE